ncbi:MAG: trypsin-like peptidase domain-containing protein [Planctomycetota bacterium]
MRRIVAFGPAFVVLAVLAAVTFLGPAAVQRLVFTQTQAEVVLARQVLQDDDILERIDRATRRIAEAVKPSVVHIEVTLRAGDGEPVFGPGASGSGWVYDLEGHIVTNAHVIGAAESAQVEFANGRTTTARLVEADAFTDIAVLKVDPGIGVIPVGRDSSRRVELGDRVFAFGSPFNFKFSMSEGIVSGLGRNPRTRSSGNEFTNYIQTDAAVNPGNSGGPLVNIYGELVGMNVAIATGSRQSSSTQGQSAGISFAIPLGVVESVVDQIINNGEVRRGFLGITSSRRFDSQTTDVLNAEGEYVGRGVLVASVEDGLAADRAGIEPGDIITRIGMNEIREWHHLRSVISTAKPGARIDVEVWRDGAPITTQVNLAEFPDVQLQRNALVPALAMAGVRFGEIDTEAGTRVVVGQIWSQGIAGQAGLREGDLIVEVNGDPVTDELSFFAALGRAEAIRGKLVRLTVLRGDVEKSLSLRLN